MTQSRAEFRRSIKAAKKAVQYKRTGFVDRSTYQCAVPGPECDSNGNPLARPFSTAQLHQRAVERRDRKRMIEKLVAQQAEASKQADKERRAEKKAATRAAYLAGCAKPQPVEYMHSAARRRLSQPAVAMAA